MALPTSLRDLLTGAIPGNVLNQIPLGNANDPQFNRFTYNIFGQLGPGGDGGVHQPGVPNIFAGPYSGSVGPQAPQQAPKPQGFAAGMGGAGGTMQRSPLIGSAPAMAGQYRMNHSLQTQNPLSYGHGGGDPGATLRNRMISWKL